ncbi:hypothetical protein SAMN05428969_2022 [Devosia sp. YR412]|nr:hypothetical protein SAMN05428969_2022 [Devosia sp. YR412]
MATTMAARYLQETYGADIYIRTNDWGFHDAAYRDTLQ